MLVLPLHPGCIPSMLISFLPAPLCKHGALLGASLANLGSEHPRLLTDLPVSHADKPLVHQLVSAWVSGLPLHDVTLSSLICQGDGRNLSRNDQVSWSGRTPATYPGPDWPGLTMSVPRSMQRMVMVPRGRGMLAMMNSRKGVISGMLLVRV